MFGVFFYLSVLVRSSPFPFPRFVPTSQNSIPDQPTRFPVAIHRSNPLRHRHIIIILGTNIYIMGQYTLFKQKQA